MPTPLLFPLFSTAEMERVFSTDNTFAQMLAFELSLAEAQSDLGLIHPNVASFIRMVRPSDIETGRVGREGAEASNIAVPFVKILTEQVAKRSPEAARYVHFGATSQDVLDTALILQLQAAFLLIESDLVKLMKVLALLTAKHKKSVMVGRTLLQHAMPTTFGVKTAGLLDALMRHYARIQEMKPRLFTLQCGGAAGTLSGYGAKANELVLLLAEKLELNAPLMPFHSYRDRILEAAHVLSSLSLSLGKFASDITLMMQTEVGEVFEGAQAGRGGSSAMPHKRNPALSTLVVAGASQLGGFMANLYANAMHEHERSVGGWQSEWVTLPLIVKITGAVTQRSLNLLEGLDVRTEQMRHNLDLTFGLIYTEKLKSALAPFIGIQEAHSTLEMASKEAIARGKHLKNVLPSEITRHLSKDALESLFDPLQAIGDAEKICERVLAAYSKL